MANATKNETFQHPMRLHNIFYELCGPESYSILDAHMLVYSFDPGDRIFIEGDPVKGIYIVNDGIIKVVTMLDKPDERILKIAGPGDLLGHRGLSSDVYPIGASALTPSKVSFLPINVFTSLIRGYSELSLYLIRFLSEELKISEKNVLLMTKLEVMERIAVLILDMAGRFGYRDEDATLPKFMPSRKDLANLAGTSYETVIRSLASLEKLKLIQLEKKNIRILNADGLRQLFAKHIHGF